MFLIRTDLHELVVNADIGQEHRETSLELVEMASRRLVLSQRWGLVLAIEEMLDTEKPRFQQIERRKSCFVHIGGHRDSERAAQARDLKVR
jgi:hypothetical protein